MFDPGGLAVMAGIGFVKTMYSANEASKIDEKALKKYAKAFEKGEEAKILIAKKAEYTDKRLKNVVKKKRAIISKTLPKFVEVYEKIQRLDLEINTNFNELALYNKTEQLAVLRNMSISLKKEFTDKELVCGCLTKGLGKMIVKDSERYLSAAKSQMSAANVAYSQAESICAVYDAIIARADRISKILMCMNALFIKSINATSEKIERNGLNVHSYNQFDKSVLMNCVDIACAISEIMNVPVMDEDGQIAKEAEDMIVRGEENLAKMEQLINM